MVYPRSAEQFVTELDEIVRRFRAGAAAGMGDGPALEEALLQLRKLGFTTGEAIHLLRQAPARREQAKA